jgi:uncharacterized membrane protein YjjB (DUF3815 family)
MKITHLIRSYVVWALAVIILLIGFWGDLTEEIDMFPASIFTIPAFLILLPLGFVYFYLAKHLKNGILFHLRDILLILTIFNVLSFFSFLEKMVNLMVLLLKNIVYFYRSIESYYLFAVIQLIAILIFLVTIIRKKE